MYLKVIKSTETAEAKNGNPYQTLTFQPLERYEKIPGFDKPVEVKSMAQPRSRTIWNGQVDTVELGDVVAGKIKSFNVEPYEIPTTEGQPAREVTTFTGIVFEGETDEVALAAYGRKLATVAKVIVEHNADVNAKEEIAGVPVAEPVQA